MPLEVDAHADQVFTQIFTVAEFNCFAVGLQVPQVGGPRERIHLCTAVIDIVFAHDVVAGELQQPTQRIPEHRPPGMTDMKRAGRVRRNELQVDPSAGTDVRAAETGTCDDRGPCDRHPGIRTQAEVDESGTCNLHPVEPGIQPQQLRQLAGQLGGPLADGSRRHDRGIGREFPVLDRLRPFNRHGRKLNVPGITAFLDDRAQKANDVCPELGE